MRYLPRDVAGYRKIMTAESPAEAEAAILEMFRCVTLWADLLAMPVPYPTELLPAGVAASDPFPPKACIKDLSRRHKDPDTEHAREILRRLYELFLRRWRNQKSAVIVKESLDQVAAIASQRFREVFGGNPTKRSARAILEAAILRRYGRAKEDA